MADPEDIDKLLAEIAAMNTGSAGTPAKPGAPAALPVPAAEPRHGGRGSWTAVAAGGAGVVGLITGSVLAFLPYISGLPTGLGAALGGAAVAAISGPPTWWGRRD